MKEFKKMLVLFLLIVLQGLGLGVQPLGLGVQTLGLGVEVLRLTRLV